ncbi:UNVERIFIED_CONTAM: Retrovirus-related Pol polyprotein from transposon TNT 1-94 [Sesamum latifolium]|uniref:Retrovirus-related Pol polyprotein from transposon TNT 1-94 n=1 Tax=Sesamum latifolium TaxID=2727402 RepID=A0AAW2YBC0_9LAMI
MLKEKWKGIKRDLLQKDTYKSMVWTMKKSLLPLLAWRQYGCWPLLRHKTDGRFIMDVKSVFLNGTLEEEVYVEQPKGFSVNGHENKVLKLKKALYGLSKHQGLGIVILTIIFKRMVSQDVFMKVKQQSDGIFISQEAYARETLKKFKMMECNPVTTPTECGVKLSKDDGVRKVDSTTFRSLLGVYGYCDSDYAGDVEDRKSTTEFVFYFGENAISWFSRKQLIVTLSTCESKYVATTVGTCHAIWIRTLLIEHYFAQDGATKIMLDNKSAIALAKNPVFHDRSKHIDARFHFIRDCIVNKEIEVEYVKTLNQVADIFTKALKKDRF